MPNNNRVVLRSYNEVENPELDKDLDDIDQDLQKLDDILNSLTKKVGALWRYKEILPEGSDRDIWDSSGYVVSTLVRTCIFLMENFSNPTAQKLIHAFIEGHVIPVNINGNDPLAKAVQDAIKPRGVTIN